MTYGSANNLHLSERESVTSREVTGCATRHDVPFDVRLAILDPVKAARAVGRSAVDARLHYECENLARGEIAIVIPTVGFSQIYGTPLVRSAVAQLPVSRHHLLLGRKICPAVGSVVPAPLTFSMASAALVGETIFSRCVAQKVVRCCRKFSAATIATFEALLGSNSILSGHSHTVSDKPNGGQKKLRTPLFNPRGEYA